MCRWFLAFPPACRTAALWSTVCPKRQAADILIAFDDGELKSFPPQELLEEIKAQTLQELEPSRLGLVNGDDGHAMAADLTWVHLGKGVSKPCGVLLETGARDESLGSLPIYTHHIVITSAFAQEEGTSPLRARVRLSSMCLRHTRARRGDLNRDAVASPQPMQASLAPLL